MNDPLTIRRLYGRTQGHPLRAYHQSLVDDLLPKLAIPEEGPLTALSLFGDERPLELEIGFGMGEHLAFQAEARPDAGFLGAEPYLNGVASLLADIDKRNLANIRVYRGDALDLLDRLPDESLSRVWLLHPDPWPKARHAKRRFVNPGPIGLVARRLIPGGELRIATDHVGYLRHTLGIMQNQSAFEWIAEREEDWQSVPSDWPDTRFALKARNLGHDIWRLIYRRC